MRRWRFVFALALAGAPLAAGRTSRTAAAAALTADAGTFETEQRDATARYLAALRPESRTRAQFAFDDAQRLDWHFIPRERRGLPLAAMEPQERLATDALLRSFLSSRGYLRVDGVLGLEQVLREAEQAKGGDGLWRNRELYFVSVFGESSGSAPWGWRFEGHHLSLNFTGVAGSGIAATPLFLGANPGQVRSGPRTGFELLGAIGTAARALLAALPSAQRADAVVATAAPADVLFGPGKAPPDLAQGLELSKLEEGALARLVELVQELPLNDLRASQTAALQTARLRGQPAAEGRFVWAGSEELGKPHYWRLVLGTAVTEWDNTQDDANHVHLLVRDVRHDFAGEWLQLHHRAEER